MPGQQEGVAPAAASRAATTEGEGEEPVIEVEIEVPVGTDRPAKFYVTIDGDELNEQRHESGFEGTYDEFERQLSGTQVVVELR